MDAGGYVAIFISIIIAGAMIGLPSFFFWMAHTKKGQRFERKEIMKASIRRGMRDAEIEEGIFEEALLEVAQKEERKRQKRQDNQ